MSVLLDTNLLLRSVEPRHPMHAVADAAVATLLAKQETVCLVSQNLYEFWVVGTRAIAQNGLGLTAPQVESELGRFKMQFAVHDDTPPVRIECERLVGKYGIVGKNAHDTRLVAAMIVHGIKKVLTFNTADFQRYQEITPISPVDVLASAPKGAAP